MAGYSSTNNVIEDKDSDGSYVSCTAGSSNSQIDQTSELQSTTQQTLALYLTDLVSLMQSSSSKIDDQANQTRQVVPYALSINDLPNEVMMMIISHLKNPKDFLSFGQTSSQYRNLTKDTIFEDFISNNKTLIVNIKEAISSDVKNIEHMVAKNSALNVLIDQENCVKDSFYINNLNTFFQNLRNISRKIKDLFLSDDGRVEYYRDLKIAKAYVPLINNLNGSLEQQLMTLINAFVNKHEEFLDISQTRFKDQYLQNIEERLDSELAKKTGEKNSLKFIAFNYRNDAKNNLHNLFQSLVDDACFVDTKLISYNNRVINIDELADRFKNLIDVNFPNHGLDFAKRRDYHRLIGLVRAQGINFSKFKNVMNPEFWYILWNRLQNHYNRCLIKKQ